MNSLFLRYTPHFLESISLATQGEKVKRFTTMKILLEYIQEDFQRNLD